MEQAQQLIQKYLDELATSAELAELEALLCSDPAVADLFAVATRTAAFLTRRLGEEADLGPPLALPLPARPRWRRLAWRWTTAAAVLLAACVVGVLLWVRERSLPGYALISGEVLDGAGNSQLDAGALLEVKGDEPAVLRLPRGTRIELRPASQFVLRGRRGETHQVVELLRGSGIFQVPAGQGGFQVDTAAGNIHVLGTRFTVALLTPEMPRAGRLAVRPEWHLTVAVAEGTVRVWQDGNFRDVAAGEQQEFHKPVPADIVGRVVAVSHQQSRRNTNGVEEAFAETHVRILVQGGKVEKGAQRTVRLDDRTVPEKLPRLAPGMVVQIWLDPRADDTAIYLERSVD